jgi:hypothetical protein
MGADTWRVCWVPPFAGLGSRIIGLNVPPAHLREQYGFRSVAFAYALELRSW